MTKVDVGIACVVAGGLMQGNFTIPMKYMPRWNWENLWLAFNVFALIILPWIVAMATIPDLMAIYRQAVWSDILFPFFFGAMWGVGNVFCGLGVAEVGTALGMSLVVGLAGAGGTIIPLLRQPADFILSSRGLTILAGVALMCAGVAVGAVAGARKDENRHEPSARKSVKGIVYCLISGITSGSLNFALIFGHPLQLRAQAIGYSPGVSSNAIWTCAMAGSFLVNLSYCLYIMRKNRSAERFGGSGTSVYWLYCLSMAIMLTGGIFVYGYGAASMGPLGPSIGWTILMCCTVLAANVSGFVTGEWRGVKWQATRLMVAGSTLLIVAAVVVGSAS